ncbi:hypothetical protein [Anoxybacillus ayderensis]|uniref:hypothetical protein n=1 Tax=Anoxybacillus ayderensis TaxID=265546 RepID=UPI002E1D346E|nr:hypothetical protein [Anoxybacillus ayderensis]
MRKYVYIFTCLFYICSIYSVAAQENVFVLENALIQVMPEYANHPNDRSNKPSMLVGMHLSFRNVSEQKQKGAIVIPLPTKEKGFRIGYVAQYVNDEPEEIDYVLDLEKGYISFEVNKEIQSNERYDVVIEYYTKNIKLEKKKRTITYTYHHLLPIEHMKIIFYQPLKADSFKIIPSPQYYEENSYGMGMYLYEFTKLKQGDVKTFDITYSREDMRSTYELLNEYHGNQKEQKNKTLPPMLVASAVVGGSFFSITTVIFTLYKRRMKNGK